MTTHRTVPGLRPLRENYTAIAARAVYEVASGVRAFTQTSRSVSAQEFGANAVPAEEVTVLSERVPMVLPALAHQTIMCDAGTVWITQGDSKDYVLNAGQSLALAPRDQVIVLAMFAPAVVRCIPPPVRKP